jgi:hypothetical protein
LGLDFGGLVCCFHLKDKVNGSNPRKNEGIVEKSKKFKLT